MIRPFLSSDMQDISDMLYSDNEWAKTLWGNYNSISIDSDYWNPAFVYEEDGKVIAYVKMESDSVHRYTNIQNLYVNVNHRKKWIAKKLLEKCYEYAISIWFNVTELVCFTEELSQMYQKLWFTLLSHYKKPYYVWFQDKYILYKYLWEQ